MSRIDDLIAEHCPQGVEFRKLGEVAAYSDTRISAASVGEDTFVGVDNLLPNQAGCTTSTYVPKTGNLTEYLKGDILIGNIRPYLKKIWLAANSGGCSGDVLAVRIRKEFQPRLLPTFLYRLLSSEAFFEYDMQHAKGAKMPRGSKSMILKYRIPVPPLEVQREIVKVLDTFTALEAELEAELEARRRQYQYYRDALLGFEGREDVRWATLGDIGKVSMCKRIFKNETTNEGDIPFYKIGTFGGKPDAFISRNIYEEYKHKYSFPNKGDVLISAAGTIGRAISYDGEVAYFQDSNIVWIANDESLVTNRYLWHWYQIVQWTTDGGTIQRLYNENIRQTRIAIPSLEEQTRIVAILDKFDALVNDLTCGLPAEITARRQQYEHYRDRLLSFREAA